MARKELFRVSMPRERLGSDVYHGVHFLNGVANNVEAGIALDEFKDWGYKVEPMPELSPEEMTYSYEEVQEAVAAATAGLYTKEQLEEAVALAVKNATKAHKEKKQEK